VWDAVRASRIVSPQHGQATHSLYSRFRLSPHTDQTELPRPGIVWKIGPISGESTVLLLVEDTYSATAPNT